MKLWDHIKITNIYTEAYNVYAVEMNKITLSSNDGRRLKTFDRIRSYPYGINAGKVCKTEFLEHLITKRLF